MTPQRDPDRERCFLHRAAGLTRAWASHVRDRLDQGQHAHGDTWANRRLDEMLDEMHEDAADLGGWAVLAAHLLDARDDLDATDREEIERGLRIAAHYGARAWAYVEGVRRRLARIEGRGSETTT